MPTSVEFLDLLQRLCAAADLADLPDVHARLSHALQIFAGENGR
jgi:hypothetical protein